MGRPGLLCRVAEGPCDPLCLLSGRVGKTQQSGGGEKPQTSCPLAGMCKHLGEGRSTEEWETEEKIILIKHLCKDHEGTCPMSPGPYRILMRRKLIK